MNRASSERERLVARVNGREELHDLVNQAVTKITERDGVQGVVDVVDPRLLVSVLAENGMVMGDGEVKPVYRAGKQYFQEMFWVRPRKRTSPVGFIILEDI